MMNRRAMSSFVKNPLKVGETIEKIFEDDLHARRVMSLANGVVGVLDAAVLSIHAIGCGYAHASNNSEKHGVKQTDRMLGNAGIDVWALFASAATQDRSNPGVSGDPPPAPRRGRQRRDTDPPSA